MERAVFTQRTQTDQFEVLDNRFHGVQSREVSRQVVTVLDDGRLGIATGTLLSDPDVLTREAQSLCRFSRRVDYGLPASGSSVCGPQNLGVGEIATEEIVDVCLGLVEALCKRYPEVTVDVIARRTRSEVTYENSHGVRHKGEERSLVYAVIVQRSTEEDLFSDYALFDHAVHGDAGGFALERHIEQLAQRFPIAETSSGELPALVLAQSLEQFLAGFWQALDGKRLFEKQSPLSDRFGQKLFDERFSLAIDPLSQGDGGFDVEGVASRPLPLVEGGVLKNAFFDLEYAPKCRQPLSGLATGNLRDRFRTSPLSIPFGARSQDQILGSVGPAVIVQHCPEVARTTNLEGDFSCGVDALYFDGRQVVGRIKNLNMSGNVLELFRTGLGELSSEGERSPSLGIVAPHILFRAIRFTV
jgi:PmbA protein